MSEAINLLNSLGEAAAEGLITIDGDRMITVPDPLRRLAVQYDHNIETVTFECPRYWDGHDLSAMDIYINYICADNKPGAFKAINVVAADDAETMTFDWVISRDVTSAAGNIVFLICAKQVDAEGNLEYDWNSEICSSCYISKGMEFGEIMEKSYPDITAVIAEQAAALIDGSLSLMVGSGVIE